MAIDTLFLCFLQDSEINDGSKEKPFYMSRYFFILDLNLLQARFFSKETNEDFGEEKRRNGKKLMNPHPFHPVIVM